MRLWLFGFLLWVFFAVALFVSLAPFVRATVGGVP